MTKVFPPFTPSLPRTKWEKLIFHLFSFISPKTSFSLSWNCTRHNLFLLFLVYFFPFSVDEVSWYFKLRRAAIIDGGLRKNKQLKNFKPLTELLTDWNSITINQENYDRKNKKIKRATITMAMWKWNVRSKVKDGSLLLQHHLTNCPTHSYEILALSWWDSDCECVLVILQRWHLLVARKNEFLEEMGNSWKLTWIFREKFRGNLM